MKFINDEISKYCDSVSDSDSRFLQDLRNYTIQNEELPQMVSGNMVGNVLQVLIKSLDAKKILEIGTFTGFSAIKMAEGNPECIIDTCELMEKHVNTARHFISKANLTKQIFVHGGPALSTLETFKVNSFDFAFIDADKINYLELGAYRGATLIAALWQNDVNAYAVEHFKYDATSPNRFMEDGHPNVRTALENTIDTYKKLMVNYNCASHPHNIYIQWLAEGGLIVFTTFIFYLIFLISFIINSNAEKKYKVISLVVILIMFWPVMSTGSLIKNWYGISTFFIIGICMILSNFRKYY